MSKQVGKFSCHKSAGPHSSDPHATMSASPEPMDLINADEYHEQANQVKDTRVSSPRSASASLVTRPQHTCSRRGHTEHTHEERALGGCRVVTCVLDERRSTPHLVHSTLHCFATCRLISKEQYCVSHEKRACVRSYTRLVRTSHALATAPCHADVDLPVPTSICCASATRHIRPQTTTKYMTKYERARVLGTRALQIRYLQPTHAHSHCHSRAL